MKKKIVRKRGVKSKVRVKIGKEFDKKLMETIELWWSGLTKNEKINTFYQFTKPNSWSFR